MFLYILLALFFVILIFYYSGNKERYNLNQIVWLPWLILLFLYVFRDKTVGTDYLNYIYKFERLFTRPLTSGDFSLFGEPLYYYINYIIKTSGFSYYFLSLFVFVFSSFFLFHSVPRKYALFFVSIFFLSYTYFSGYNTIRQFIASSIVLYGMKYVDNRWYLYIVCCLFASLFHVSALLVIPFFALKYFSISYKYNVLLIILVFICLLAGIDKIVFSSIGISELLAGTNMINGFGEYDQYFEMEQEGLNSKGIFANYVVLIFNVLIYLFVNKNKIIKNTFYSKMWFAGLLFSIFVTNYQWLFRFSYYFIIAEVVSISMYLGYNHHKSQGKTIIPLGSFIVISLLFLVFIIKLYGNADGVVPYKISF